MTQEIQKQEAMLAATEKLWNETQAKIHNPLVKNEELFAIEANLGRQIEAIAHHQQNKNIAAHSSRYVAVLLRK